MGDRVNKYDLDRAFRERDVIFLSDQISNTDLGPEVREHLAGIIRDLLTGKTKFPKRRPPTSSSSKNTWKIALRILELRREGWQKLSAAVKQASAEFDCKERKAWECLKELREILRAVERRDEWQHMDWWERQDEERRREEERTEEERREEELHEEAMWEEALREEELL